MFSERPAIWAHEPDAAFRSVDWANIAEGCGRRSDNEMARFVQIAMGSGAELSYHLRLARDLELLSEASFDRLRSDPQRSNANVIFTFAKGETPGRSGSAKS